MNYLCYSLPAFLDRQRASHKLAPGGTGFGKLFYPVVHKLKSQGEGFFRSCIYASPEMCGCTNNVCQHRRDLGSIWHLFKGTFNNYVSNF